MRIDDANIGRWLNLPAEKLLKISDFRKNSVLQRLYFSSAGVPTSRMS